jgi:FixJ family two-component response regulator
MVLDAGLLYRGGRGDADVNDVPVIAIVDDDPSLRRSLLRIVHSAGYRGEAFADGRELLDWLPSGRAACVVLDVHLPGMSGFDIQERIDVPIVFITAHDDVATRVRMEHSGAAGLLHKPFEATTLLEAIRRSLGTTPT